MSHSPHHCGGARSSEASHQIEEEPSWEGYVQESVYTTHYGHGRLPRVGEWDSRFATLDS